MFFFFIIFSDIFDLILYLTSLFIFYYLIYVFIISLRFVVTVTAVALTTLTPGGGAQV